MMSVTSALSREQAIARILELTGRPEARGDQPWLVVLAGLPGSGKSTFARRLSRSTGAIVLESDALRVALFGRPTHEPQESRQLFDALYAAADRLLQQGARVIVDATNLRARDRRQACEAARASQAGVLLLHFRAPLQVIAARLASRGGGADPDDRSSAGLAVYAKLAETEEAILRDHWKIDTSDPVATDSALQRAIETLEPRTSAAGGRDTGGSIS